MRIPFLSLIFFVSVALDGATPSLRRPTQPVHIVGTVVAYDHLNNLIRMTFVPSRVVFIVRTKTRGKDKSQFIKVAYTYWSSNRANDGGFPDELITGVRQLRFKLIRDISCDEPVQEFSLLREDTGKAAEVSLPIWKVNPGAENEKIPFGETLRCYSLRADGYKPYRQ